MISKFYQNFHKMFWLAVGYQLNDNIYSFLIKNVAEIHEFIYYIILINQIIHDFSFFVYVKYKESPTFTLIIRKNSRSQVIFF